MTPFPLDSYAIHNHILLFIDSQPMIWAIDLNTGEYLWNIRYPSYAGARRSERLKLWLKYIFADPLSLAQENLLIAQNHGLYVVSPGDGQLLSWRRLKGWADSTNPPVVGHQSIYLGTREGLMRYK
jgi:hypothetical protein